MSFLRRFASPLDCRPHVLWQSFARFRSPAHAELGLGVTLFRGFSIPLHGFSFAARSPAAIDESQTESELRVRVALLGGFAIPGECGGVILSDALSRRVHAGKRMLRWR